MDGVVQPQAAIHKPDYREAWEMVSGQLRVDMGRAQFETWVQPLKPLGYSERVFRLSAINPYNRDWVENHLQNRITSLLSGMLNEPVTVKVVVSNGFSEPAGRKASAEQAEPAHEPAEETADEKGAASDGLADDEPTPGSGKASPRKLMLYRAYGSRRAQVIQPDRGLFMTLYFFNNWLPLLGQSAFTLILAARSMCYWNPKTGELRNSVETEMEELAQRAALSVRTVKAVLNSELVRKHFLRYTVRRVMTPNGIRTAGILLQVRMDDPLTPSDQAESGMDEEGTWYSAEFEDESEE